MDTKDKYRPKNEVPMESIEVVSSTKQVDNVAVLSNPINKLTHDEILLKASRKKARFIKNKNKSLMRLCKPVKVVLKDLRFALDSKSLVIPVIQKDVQQMALINKRKQEDPSYVSLKKKRKLIPKIFLWERGQSRSIAVYDHQSEELDIYNLNSDLEITTYRKFSHITSETAYDNIAEFNRWEDRPKLERFCCWFRRENYIKKSLTQYSRKWNKFSKKIHPCNVYKCSCCCNNNRLVPRYTTILIGGEEPHGWFEKLVSHYKSLGSEQTRAFGAIEKALVDVPRSKITLKNNEVYQRLSINIKINDESYHIRSDGHLALHVNNKHPEVISNVRFNVNRTTCCWYKREQLADTILKKMMRQSTTKFIITPHLCPSIGCTCCCRPKYLKKIELRVSLKARHTINVSQKPTTVKINFTSIPSQCAADSTKTMLDQRTNLKPASSMKLNATCLIPEDATVPPPVNSIPKKKPTNARVVTYKYDPVCDEVISTTVTTHSSRATIQNVPRTAPKGIATANRIHPGATISTYLSNVTDSVIDKMLPYTASSSSNILNQTTPKMIVLHPAQSNELSDLGQHNAGLGSTNNISTNTALHLNSTVPVTPQQIVLPNIVNNALSITNDSRYIIAVPIQTSHVKESGISNWTNFNSGIQASPADMPGPSYAIMLDRKESTSRTFTTTSKPVSERKITKNIQQTVTSAAVQAGLPNAIIPGLSNYVIPGPFHSVIPGPSNLVIPGPSNSVIPRPSNSVISGPSNSVMPGPSNSVIPRPFNSVIPGPSNSVIPRPLNSVIPGPSNSAGTSGSNLLHNEASTSTMFRAIRPLAKTTDTAKMYKRKTMDDRPSLQESTTIKTLETLQSIKFINKPGEKLTAQLTVPLNKLSTPALFILNSVLYFMETQMKAAGLSNENLQFDLGNIMDSVTLNDLQKSSMKGLGKSLISYPTDSDQLYSQLSKITSSKRNRCIRSFIEFIEKQNQ